MRREAVFIGITLLALGVIIAFAGRSSSPYQETALRRHAIFDRETYTIDPSSYKAWYYEVNLEGMGLGNKYINGTVEVADGGEINFYVMDRSNYIRWEEGETTATYVNSTGRSSHTFNFYPDKSGDYIFVMDNRHPQTPKEVTANIIEYWRATETRYRTIYDFRNLIAGLWLGVLGLILLVVGRSESPIRLL
ncbi:MAG: hypothetical protein ACE5Z5_14880 [Candidatus Bathyarchaeia archaeon]